MCRFGNNHIIDSCARIGDGYRSETGGGGALGLLGLAESAESNCFRAAPATILRAFSNSSGVICPLSRMRRRSLSVKPPPSPGGSGSSDIAIRRRTQKTATALMSMTMINTPQASKIGV
jgi:hypothetical protein